MSSSLPELTPRPADEALVRAHAEELRSVAQRHGISELRFASAGRLVGKVDQARDLFDVAAFDVEASDVLGAAVMLFSDRVLAKPNVSADLVSARAL
ncbi:MAG: hypothetical protein ACYCTI_02660 [Acidimicrobiales bacterium]